MQEILGQHKIRWQTESQKYLLIPFCYLHQESKAKTRGDKTYEHSIPL